jgi:glycerol uptake facilitator-like aquaporin
MGARLSAGNTDLALLANSLATGAGLTAFILAFQPVSGAHLNPAVTITEAWRGAFPWREVPAYLASQVVGAFAGVAAAHLMFGEQIFTVSQRARPGAAQMFSESLATFGLILVIRGASRRSPPAVAWAVSAYITAAYWFTSSTSFANPAVTLARAATNTFSGVQPGAIPGFLLAQLCGAVAASGVCAVVFGKSEEAPAEE